MLACDLGGIRIKVGIVEQRRILACDTLPAGSETGLSQALPWMTGALLNLCRRI